MAHKFKMTEIGPIPEEWELRRIDTSFDFVGNNTFARESMSSVGEVVNIHYGDVLIKYGANVDVSSDSVMFLDSSIRTKAVHALQSGDIVMADTAEDETAGKCCEIIGAENRQVEAGLHTFVLRPRDKYAPKFLGYAFNAECYHNQLIPLMQGTKVTSISKGAVGSTFLICPPYSEQEIIAKALNDIDILIIDLKSLIAKKQLIKQGSMQQLLTGKKRLEGFSEPWVEKEIGEIINVSKGQSLQSKNFVNGNVPVVAGGQTYAGFHNIANHSNTSVTISASGAYAGFVWLHEYPIFASDCSVIEGNDNVDIHFLYNVLKLKQNEIYNAQTGGAQPHIHPKDIEPINIKIPFKDGKPYIDEQIAIANILTSMDSEISALEAKRAKYEFIKQGMMQELLTGKIRLV